MKRLFLLMSMLFVCVGACMAQSTTPKGTVDQYIKYVIAGNYEAVVDLGYFEGLSAAQVAEVKKIASADLRENFAPALKQLGGIKSYAVTKEDINGSTATVYFDMVYGNGDADKESNKLQNIGGKWYIIFE